MQRLSLLRVIKLLFSYCVTASVDMSSLSCDESCEAQSGITWHLCGNNGVTWEKEGIAVGHTCKLHYSWNWQKELHHFFLYTAEISFPSHLVVTDSPKSFLAVRLFEPVSGARQQFFFFFFKYFLKSSLLLCFLVKPEWPYSFLLPDSDEGVISPGSSGNFWHQTYPLGYRHTFFLINLSFFRTHLTWLITFRFLLQRSSVQSALVSSSSVLIFFVTVLHCGMLMQECPMTWGPHRLSLSC